MNFIIVKGLIRSSFNDIIDVTYRFIRRNVLSFYTRVMLTIWGVTIEFKLIILDCVGTIDSYLNL